MPDTLSIYNDWNNAFNMCTIAHITFEDQWYQWRNANTPTILQTYRIHFVETVQSVVCIEQTLDAILPNWRDHLITYNH